MCVCTRSRVVAAAANDNATNGIERVMTAAREPFRVGRGMVGHEARVEAGRLGRPRALHHRVAGDELRGVVDVVGGQSDREAHRRILRTRLRRVGSLLNIATRKGASVTTIYYERDADLGVLDGQRIAVVGYGNQGRSWALNLRDSGCAPVVCVRRDETREQADGRRLRGARRGGRERRRHHLHPRARRRDRAAAARAERRLVRDRRERLHARLRPPRSARRQRDGRAAHARPRGAPLLRGRRRVHHRGRCAPRRHRAARSHRVLAIAQGDRRSAPGRARAHADAGGGARSRCRAGALARARPR